LKNVRFASLPLQVGTPSDGPGVELLEDGVGCGSVPPGVTAGVPSGDDEVDGPPDAGPDGATLPAGPVGLVVLLPHPTRATAASSRTIVEDGRGTRRPVRARITSGSVARVLG
jgi:hypothetical protein